MTVPIAAWQLLFVVIRAVMMTVPMHMPVADMNMGPGIVLAPVSGRRKGVRMRHGRQLAGDETDYDEKW